MAGFTGFSVGKYDWHVLLIMLILDSQKSFFLSGLCNNKMCLLPIPELVATSPRQLNGKGRTWERVLAVTRQPNTRKLTRKTAVGLESQG